MNVLHNNHPLASLARLLDEGKPDNPKALLRVGELLAELGDERLFTLALEVIALLSEPDVLAIADTIVHMADGTIDQIVTEAIAGKKRLLKT